MLTLPAVLGQFEPIDGTKVPMDEALARFAPIFQEVYRAAGNPETDRERLFVLRTIYGIHGWNFASTCFEPQTQEESYTSERGCMEYSLLCELGLIV